MTKITLQAVASPALLYVCNCVTAQGIPWMFQAVVSERYKVLTVCTYTKVSEAYKELVATCKNWDIEDLESCTRQVLYMSLWWLKEPSPRKAGIDITLRAATTRDSNSIWIFSVLNLRTFLVRHHLYSSLKITFSTCHSTCVLLASTFSNSSLRRQILMIYLDPGLIFSRQKHHWSTLGHVTVLGQMSMAKERCPIRT